MELLHQLPHAGLFIQYLFLTASQFLSLHFSRLSFGFATTLFV
jgi:hypothetical protein